MTERTGSGAHDAAVAAMIRMRTVGARLFDAITEAQSLAPHHLFALRAVADGARTISDVAHATDRHVSSVSRTVDQLVGEDLLVRAEDPTDRRQVVLRTTPAGAAVVERFASLDAALMRRVMHGLDEGDAAEAARIFTLMVAEAHALLDELGDPPVDLGRLG